MRRLVAVVGLASLAGTAAGCARRVAEPAPPVTVARPPLPAPAPAQVGTPPAAGTPPVAGPSRPVPTDSRVYFERPNGALLQPGTLVYDLFTIRDSTRISQGVRTVVVTEATVAGLASWLVADTRSGTVVETRDSLYLARADLSPQRWVASIGRAQLAVSFSRDSMFGGLQSYQGRSSFAAALPPGALVTAGMVDRIVELLPLAPGFRAAASLVQLDLGAPREVPAELAVAGEEKVLLADREVDCWVVTLRAGAVAERLWVSKSPSRVVRTEQPTNGGILTAALRQ